MLHPHDTRRKVLRGVQGALRQYRKMVPAMYAALLVAWLNAKPRRRAQQRIISLLENLRSLVESDSQSATSRTAVVHLVRVVRPLRKAQRQSDPRLIAIHRELRSYRGFVFASSGWQGWQLGWECSRPISMAEMDKRAAAGTLSREQAFDLISLISRDKGALRLVRQCVRCHKWFFAQQSPNVYCSQDCQRKKYRSREEWLEHRRKYMRDYRRDNQGL